MIRFHGAMRNRHPTRPLESPFVNREFSSPMGSASGRVVISRGETMNIRDAAAKTGKYTQWMVVAVLSSISAMIFSLMCANYFSVFSHFSWVNTEAGGYANAFLFSAALFTPFFYLLAKKFTRQTWKFSLHVSLAVITIALANLFFASFALYTFLIIELAAEALSFLRRYLQQR
jgi:hypothetical protein